MEKITPAAVLVAMDNCLINDPDGGLAFERELSEQIGCVPTLPLTDFRRQNGGRIGRATLTIEGQTFELTLREVPSKKR